MGAGVVRQGIPLFFPVLQVSDILRYLFPVPKDDSHRVITFANQDDYISFRCVSAGLWGDTLTSVSLCCLLLTHSCSLPLALAHLPRHHVYRKTDHRNVELTEVGPRFELKCELGALCHVWWWGHGCCIGDNIPVLLY